MVETLGSAEAKKLLRDLCADERPDGPGSRGPGGQQTPGSPAEALTLSLRCRERVSRIVWTCDGNAGNEANDRHAARTENLTKHYGSFVALDDFTFDATAGEVVGLLGPNGSGKTTALRLIMGFLRPTSGRARVGGHDCWSDSVAVRRLTAYLPGELRLYENMTGRQLIQFLCKLRGQPVNGEIESLSRKFDIDIDRPIANLSSGMKRKVALLQVLAPHAALVIMDEPTNTLDPNMRDLLLEQVSLARGRGQTVLFSSHVLSEVERVCDRVAVLQKGKLVHVQNMAQLQEGRLVHARFAGPAPRRLRWPDCTFASAAASSWCWNTPARCRNC